jgi:hypothetical protein
MGLERVLRWTLVSIAISGLVLGIAARANGQADVADLCFTFATIPVIAGLAVSIIRDLLAGRVGVDAIALVSMSAAIALRQPLAGAVVALMYSGGNVLEDIAVSRAEHDLRALVGIVCDRHELAHRSLRPPAMNPPAIDRRRPAAVPCSPLLPQFRSPAQRVSCIAPDNRRSRCPARPHRRAAGGTEGGSNHPERDCRRAECSWRPHRPWWEVAWYISEEHSGAHNGSGTIDLWFSPNTEKERAKKPGGEGKGDWRG